jgi:hypothetical protein
VRTAPAVSCAMRIGARTGMQAQRRHPASRVMALRLMPCSPRRRIRLVTVVGGFSDSSTPVGFELATADLPPATGVRTTQFCRTPKRRSSCAPVNRSRGSTRPATSIARRRSRVHHIPSRVRDDARPPSCRNGIARVKPLFWGPGEAEVCPSCQSVARRRGNRSPLRHLSDASCGRSALSIPYDQRRRVSPEAPARRQSRPFYPLVTACRASKSELIP